MDSTLLIAAKEAKLVLFTERGPFHLIFPGSLVGISGHLGEGYIVQIYNFIGKALSVWLEFVMVFDGIRAGEFGDDAGVALLQIPEIMDVAVRQDHEAGILLSCIATRLFLGSEGVLSLGLRFKDDQRFAFTVEQ